MYEQQRPQGMLCGVAQLPLELLCIDAVFLVVLGLDLTE
jgi:hypothetical protein